MHHIHPVIYNPTQEEMEAIMEEIDVEGDIEIYKHPSIVVCPLCKESFETELDQPIFDSPED